MGNHEVAKSWTWLSDFTFTFHFHALEKEMATHSSVLAWRIPGMGEPVGLPSMGSQRVGHDWSNLAAAARYLLSSYFCIPIPYNEKDIFWMLVLEGLECPHRTIQLQLLQDYRFTHRLRSLWYWMVCLGNKQRSFCHFWDCTQELHFRLFCWLWGLIHLF